MEAELGISTDHLNWILRGVLWELHLDAEKVGDLAEGSDSLLLTVREGNPRLRVYYVLHNGTCELKFLEIDPEWSVANLTAWRLIAALWPDAWGP